jgi:hypothetical protein
VSIFRATNALTPLATPTPPSSSAISPTTDEEVAEPLDRPREPALVVGDGARAHAARRDGARRGPTQLVGATPVRQRTSASYSARLPKTSSCVSAR